LKCNETFLQKNYFLASDLIGIAIKVQKPVLSFVSATEKCQCQMVSFLHPNPAAAAEKKYRKPNKIL
jgi:hypothetical protein